MTVRQRIMSALAANAFGQAVTLASQIVLTPMFFRFWGAAKYGEWLMLSSIPAYLTMADLGIGSAAGNEMTMRASAGNHRGAQETFRGALLVSLLAGAVALTVGVVAGVLNFRYAVPATPHIPSAEAAAVLLVLALTVAIGFTGGVVSAGFRCGERNALGIVLSNTSRLLEALTMGALLLAGKSPLWLCAGGLCVKLLMLLAQMLWLVRIAPWRFTPYAAADKNLVKRLIAPSMGFLAFPLGNALALQGPILIIGYVFGGPAVAIFSAMRTLARLPIQITNVFNSSVWPEMSRAFGSGDMPMLRQLHRQTWGVTLFLTVGSGLGLCLLGPVVAHIWLGANVAYNAPLLNTLIAVTVVSATWNASSVVLAAINAHARMGLVYVLTNAATLGTAYLLTPHLGWSALLSCLLVAEVMLMAYVLPLVLATTADKLRPFVSFALVGGIRRLIPSRNFK